MERRRQREIALAAVAVVLIAAAVFGIRSATSGAPASGAPETTGAAAARPQPSNHMGQVTGVDLQALEAERPEPVEARRNPFRFKPTPAPRPPADPMRPTTPADAGPAQPAPPPRIPLKFIGVLDSPSTGRVAVLSDSRGVYQGRVGEIIEGRYRILNIGVESVDLAYLDGRGRQTIRLTGQ